MNSKIEIDWKPEFAKISPYLQGRGGVIHVFGKKEESAITNFTKILRRKMKKLGFLTVQFNPNDENTRMPTDIIAKLEEKLGINSSASETKIEIAKNLYAGGHITIKDINVNIAPDDMELAHAKLKRSHEIVNVISDKLEKNQKISFILFNAHLMQTASISWISDQL